MAISLYISRGLFYSVGGILGRLFYSYNSIGLNAMCGVWYPILSALILVHNHIYMEYRYVL